VSLRHYHTGRQDHVGFFSENFIFAKFQCAISQCYRVCSCRDSICEPSWSQINASTTGRCCITQFLYVIEGNLGFLYQSRFIKQNDSFRYFRLLMSTCSDSNCENPFETSHVRFIHENFSVLITTPPDQIQQNLLRKETCQTTAKPADIFLQTWFEEYPTPPSAPQMSRAKKQISGEGNFFGTNVLKHVFWSTFLNSKDTQFAVVKLPKCLEGPHNTYDRSTNSSRMQHRRSNNSRDGHNSTHDTRQGSSQLLKNAST